MSTPLRLVLLLVLLLPALACGPRAAELRPDDPFAQAPGPGGRCLLLATNDGEANFDGRRLADGRYEGTIARVTARKKALLAAHPGQVLLVSAGDELQGRYMERQDGDRTRAAAEAYRLYERAGYDYGTLGNHEFDAGPKVLRKALGGLDKYRIVVSNLEVAGTALEHPPGKRLFVETAVADCGGMKVGFLGLLTPSTRTISDFGDLRFKNADDPVHAPAREAVRQLRAQGAQVIVALTHLGLDDDLRLAGAVEGIDAIVGGHSHTVVPGWRQVTGTVVMQAGARFSHLGHLLLAGKPGGAPGLDLARSSWRLVPIDASLPADPAIEQAVAGLRETLIPERVVGRRTVAWDVTGSAKSEYGRRAARAVWHFAQQTTGRPIDGALLNAGGLRSSTVYPPGPVTNVEIAAIHPFRNRIVLVTLTGEQLRDVGEHACIHAGNDGHGARALLWNLRLRCDASKPVVEYVWQDNKPVGIARRGERVAELEVGGKPYDPKATYTLATLDYLARGGSSYHTLEQADRKCLDGKPFTRESPCPGSPLVAEVVERGVQEGWMDAPLPD